MQIKANELVKAYYAYCLNKRKVLRKGYFGDQWDRAATADNDDALSNFFLLDLPLSFILI